MAIAEQALERLPGLGGVPRALAQIGAQGLDPAGELERLALDRDPAHGALAPALHPAVRDAQPVVRVAERHVDPLDALLLGEEAPRAAVHPCGGGQRGFELGGEHLDRGREVVRIGPQVGGGQVEGLLLGHPGQRTGRYNAAASTDRSRAPARRIDHAPSTS